MQKELVFPLILLVFSITCIGCGNNQENANQKLDAIENISHENKGYLYSKPKKNIQIVKEPKATKMPEKRNVKGIYLNRNSVKEENLNTYIDLLNDTKLNAVVIDIKDDFGKLTYDSDITMTEKIGSDEQPAIKDLHKLVNRLQKEDIYTIARIVVFKDPYLANNQRELALKRKDGSIWEDAQGTKWIDPFKKKVWDYITDISKEVAAYGFDEIQYDYIRFPENALQVDQEVSYDNEDGRKKSENVLAFLKYSKKKLENQSVYVSADVFGLVTTAHDDMGIGQQWEYISPHVDYISPMTYPSHYGPNSYGLDNPDLHPYEVVKHAMEDAIQRNDQLKAKGIKTAIIRPWIQDFDFKRAYSEKDVRNQIKALEDQGIHQYLIWNAANKYTKNAYK